MINPPSFDGDIDPAIAEEWIKTLESMFSYLRMPDENRVNCAIFLLTHRARTWWENVKIYRRVEQMTWEQFKTIFIWTYFSNDTREKKAREFLDLRQGTMTMMEYIKKFENSWT